MPKKFLGQRIESEVDFVRPSSLTLTAEDIHRLPLIPSRDEEEKVYELGTGRRISRKFGGTVKLRRRLESVPELFLHDFKKKPRRKTGKRSNLKRIEPPKITLPTVKEEDSKPLFTEGEIDRIFVSNPIVMPVEIVSRDHNVYEAEGGSPSSNELLFDEILSAYTAQDSQKVPPALSSEIDRVLEHITQNQNQKQNYKQNQKQFKSIPDLTPAIIDPETTLPLTPALDPSSPAMLERISSPEYTGASSSDRWSSGDEFSDLGCNSDYCGSDSNDDGYDTAIDTLRSKCCSPNTAAPTSTSNKVQGNGTVVSVKLHTTKILPDVFLLSDDEDSDELMKEANIKDLAISNISDLQTLQQKIETISMYSSSSSVYSDHAPDAA